MARGEGLYLAPGAALTRAAASHLAGIQPALVRMAEAIDRALRAHVEAHGPIALSDGREYGPVVELVTSYKTEPTFDALSAVVGDEAAREAFEATGASLKRALEGQPRGAWRKLRGEIEATGGVVFTGREVWRRMYPAKPVEVAGASDGDQSGQSGGASVGTRSSLGSLPSVAGERAASGPRPTQAVDAEEPGKTRAEASVELGEARVGQPVAARTPRHVLALHQNNGDGLPSPQRDPVLTPAPFHARCSSCGKLYRPTAAGLVRAHTARVGGVVTPCVGGGKAPMAPGDWHPVRQYIAPDA